MNEKALIEFLAARYAEDWSRARDAELMAGQVTSRATRDIDAKRTILDICADARESIPFGHRYDLTTVVLTQSASVYSDHPDYDPAWTQA